MKHKMFLLFLFALLQTTKSLSAESDTVWSKEIGSEVKAVKFSPDGQFIYAAAIGRKPMKLSTETGEILKEYEGFKFEGNVFFLAMDISSDGKWLICGAYGNDMHIFDTETGLIVKTLKTEYEDIQSNKFNSVTITPDKRYVIATNMFGAQEQGTKYGIVIWDAQSGELIKVINSQDAMKVEASPDNLHFAVSFNDLAPTDIKIFEIGTWETFTSLYGSIWIQDIAYSPDGSLLSSGGIAGDGILRIWNVNDKQLIKEFPDNYDVYSVNFIGNDKVIAGCGYFANRYVKIWDLTTEKLLGKIRTDVQSDLDISYIKHYCVVADSYGILVFNYLPLIAGINENIIKKEDKSHPNPTANISEINFFLPVSGNTIVSIIDANSRVIEILYNGFLEQGEHKFQWHSKGVTSGTYFCNITGQNFIKTLKIILEK